MTQTRSADNVAACRCAAIEGSTTEVQRDLAQEQIERLRQCANARKVACIDGAVEGVVELRNDFGRIIFSRRLRSAALARDESGQRPHVRKMPAIVFVVRGELDAIAL